MDLVQDFQKIAELSHDNAKHKGFWDTELKQGRRRNDGEMLSLIHSEVTELYDALISKRPSQKLADFSEIEEECADIIIRLADMVYRRGWAVTDYFTMESAELNHMQQVLQQLDSDYIRANIMVNFLHQCLGQVTEALREQLVNNEAICLAFASLILAIQFFSITYQYRVGEAIALKMHYNTQRPYMHGKHF